MLIRPVLFSLYKAKVETKEDALKKSILNAKISLGKEPRSVKFCFSDNKEADKFILFLENSLDVQRGEYISEDDFRDKYLDGLDSDFKVKIDNIVNLEKLFACEVGFMLNWVGLLKDPEIIKKLSETNGLLDALGATEEYITSKKKINDNDVQNVI